ncbi:MAG: hypothetical protein AAGB18_01305 [Pseudomonadota bacterium]
MANGVQTGLRRSLRGLGGLGALVLWVAALPAFSAEEPDTSERFREGMSICTLPGPSIDARRARLAEAGWVSAPLDAGDRVAFQDAALLLKAAEAPSVEAWAAARGEAAPVLDGTVYQNGPARLLITRDATTGQPACRLATLNSADTDRLLVDLEKAGALTATGPIRTGSMATTVFDSQDGTWRTEIDLASADATEAASLLSTPLSVTFAATFKSRERE